MNFHFFGIFIISFRFLLEFRIFERFRHLTAMIVKVYYDIFTFLTFFLGYLFIYGFLNTANQINYVKNPNERISYIDSVVAGFNIAFANYDIENYHVLDWILFFATIITITIIMLNVIIAIVSNTFKKYE